MNGLDNIKDRDEQLRYLNDPNLPAKMVDEIFAKVDTDGSGKIDRNEFQEAMKQLNFGLGLYPPTKEEVDSAMKCLDANSDGKISKKEMIPLVQTLIGLYIEDVKEGKFIQ